MANTEGSERLVRIELDGLDLNTLREGGVVEVECPHTGETIYITVGSLDAYECEECGQMVKPVDPITPSARGLADRLKSGGTAIYDSVHTEDDITLVIRADHDVCGGWK